MKFIAFFVQRLDAWGGTIIGMAACFAVITGVAVFVASTQDEEGKQAFRDWFNNITGGVSTNKTTP